MGTSRSEAVPRDHRSPVAGRRVLVANRGEIACRILRAVRDEGGIGISVYSDADRGSPHVGLADLAHRLGPAAVGESYLNADALLRAAREVRAELVHPGYGFFAENGDFADLVEKAGILWVGPPPHAMRTMGDKIAARDAVREGGVPLVPGTGELPADPAVATQQARSLGYPVLIKAAMGGGGKGMRICTNDAELHAALDLTRREAERSFGSPTIYLERVIRSPRHVEIQVLADQHGQVIHLGERECSIQRRHQKLLEETPTPVGIPGLRERMGEAAAAIARKIGYVSAGTVEFLLDPDGGFYFLEMNTRLQVEHPITEMVTRVDIVRAQLRIALGEKLEIAQSGVSWNGHAIECRINAEDPVHGFVPSTGTIRFLRLPEGPGVRNDVGFQTGTEVTPHYDPLLGKLIVWGHDREQAIQRALRAIHEYRIVGVKTNLSFHRWLLSHPRFRAGRTDTGFLDEEFRGEELFREEEETAAIVAAVLAGAVGVTRVSEEEVRAQEKVSAWRQAGRPGASGWRGAP